MTKDEIKNIWKVPKYLPYVQPNLTDEILEDAEKKIGFKLPSELVEILKIQNGGYVRYKLPETTHEQIMGIGPYFPSMTDIDWTEFKEYVNFELDGLIPFDGDGHWFICLDYRESKENPKVSWIDVECDNQEVLANSFKDFLELLELDIENELVIETENSIEFIAKQIETILQIKFESPEYFNSGYANYRSKYKDSWVWLTPNKVPTGFVRENHERFNELKDQMNTFSVLHNEISVTSFFLELSDEDLNNEVIVKLTENKIKIKPITEIIDKSPNS
jgi:SMI1-KNR4 cell-wall